MTIHRCDRCGADSANSLQFVAFHYPRGDNDLRLEVCPNCYKTVMKFAKEAPPKEARDGQD